MFLKGSLIILLFSLNAFAEDNWWDLAVAAKDRAAAAVTNYASSAGSFYESKMGGRLDQGFSYIHGAIAGASGSTDDVRTATNYRASLAQIRDSEGKKASEALAAANKAASEAAQKSAAAAQAAGSAARYNALLIEIQRGQSLTSDINNLFLKYDNVNQTMNAIEQQLDKSMLNAYIQQKTARLLSSDNLCKATASCVANKGKNKATFSFEDMKDIFPNSTTTRNAAGTKTPAPTGTNK